MNAPQLPAPSPDSSHAVGPVAPPHPAVAKLAFVSEGKPARNHAELANHAMRYLAAVYGARFPVTADTGRAFVAELGSYTLDECARAVEAATRAKAPDGRNYPPTLADVVDLAERLSARRRRAEELLASQRAENGALPTNSTESPLAHDGGNSALGSSFPSERADGGNGEAQRQAKAEQEARDKEEARRLSVRGGMASDLERRRHLDRQLADMLKRESRTQVQKAGGGGS
jgi:hypothetical protein